MIMVPPTALRLSTPPIRRDEASLFHVWHQLYNVEKIRPQIEGDLVVEYPALVEVAILLGLSLIQCRTYYFDGER